MKLSLILVLLSGLNASAYDFTLDKYRQDIRSLTLQGHRPLSNYRESRKKIMQAVHIQRDANGYFVKDVYCQISFRKNISPNSMPSANKINIEHTWPRSRFNRKENYNYQLADLHHLFPTESRSNSVRGNHKFYEFPKGHVVGDNCLTSVTGTIPQTGNTGFEPPVDHKGNVARVLFYFSIRYNLSIPDYEEFTLRQWHILDPVDAAELRRNDTVERLQGNRNPFVDEPELSQLVRDF